MDIHVFNQQGLQRVQPDDVRAFVASNTDVVWIDVHQPTHETLNQLREIFSFHPLALEDSMNQHQRPKVEEYADHLFIIVNHAARIDSDVDFQELDIFIGRNYIVTLHHHCLPVIEEVRRRIARKAQFNLYSSEYLLYTVVDVVVDSYFPLIDYIDDATESLSEAVLMNPTQEMLRELFALKRLLNEMWRITGQQRDMFNILTRREEDLLTHHDILEYYLRDVHDHLIRISDMTNVLREMVDSVVQLHVSSTSNRLNKVVNRLTVITILIGILTVISGFSGMNFEWTFPPFSAVWGVPFVLGAMLVLSLVAVVLFRRMRLF